MAFIEKKDPIILNIKLTSKGRNLLSQGNLNFKYFGVGDSEINYNNIDYNNTDIQILKAIDKNPDIISFIGTDIYNPIVSKTSKEFIITNTAPELGFFSGNTILSDDIYVKQSNIEIHIDEINGGNVINLYQSSGYTISSPEPEITDMLMVKWINKRGINSDIIDIPTPYLFYKIIGKIGALETNDLIVSLDRNLPNFNLVSGNTGNTTNALIYNNIQNTGTTLSPTSYVSNSLNDFINNSQCNNIKFPFWNLSIILTEELAGVKSGNTKFINLNTSGLIGFISYIQEQSPIYKKLGVVHYTNSSPENIYGEGFYRNTPVLKLPTLMWHKSNNTSIGLVLSGNTIQNRLSKLDLVYYDLVDNSGNVVGKIFNELKLFVIEDQDLLFALSFKSNRNWTLPELSVSIGSENSECYPPYAPIVEYIPITTEYVPEFRSFFSFNIDNTNTENWGYMELDFNSDETYYVDAYTPEEIGEVYIDTSVGIIYPQDPFPQVSPNDYNSSLQISTNINDTGETYYVGYEPATQHTITVYTKGTKTEESAWLLYLYDLWVVGTLDISMFTHLSNFDLQNASISNFIAPTSVHPEWGVDGFMLYNIQTLTTVNLSNMVLPNTTPAVNNITIRDCSDITTIYLPSTGNINYLELQNNPQLSQVNIATNTITIVNLNFSNVPLLGYFDVKQIPNLTKAVAHNSYLNYDYGGSYNFTNNEYDAATINRILVDLDTISETVVVSISNAYLPKIYLNGINAAPDSSSGGYDGIAAKASLQLKRFLIYTN